VQINDTEGNPLQLETSYVISLPPAIRLRCRLVSYFTYNAHPQVAKGSGLHISFVSLFEVEQNFVTSAITLTPRVNFIHFLLTGCICISQDFVLTVKCWKDGDCWQMFCVQLSCIQ
jgi:hypothetical protein